MVETRLLPKGGLVVANKGRFLEDTFFVWFWVRALGLPLQLWNMENLKNIGDEFEEIKDKVNGLWGSFNVNGRPVLVLAETLKLLQTKLKEWSKTTEKIGSSGRIATADKGINFINVLEVDGVTITNPKDIKEIAQNSYKHLYKETKSWRPELHRRDTSVISSEEQE
ncbi:hypothetical protein MTR67_051796 [Solanum verrucosum]|uniref:DUF4283 domain-containing protein n=1 Tax=Solanum verrucosum TaxID=315347 RepID=A0AAF1A0G0_SOLVR|nr:hypothetical protein MTR67_051796 [Solanum verrucosum]